MSALFPISLAMKYDTKQKLYKSNDCPNARQEENIKSWKENRVSSHVYK